MRIRLAAAGDAEAIRSIYNVEVSGGTNTFDLVPRTAEEQRRWLARHDGAHPAVVAVDLGNGDGDLGNGDGDQDLGEAPGTARTGAGELVLGFGVLSSFRTRPAYATSVEDSVYVHRDHRGRGVGRTLLEELVRLAAVHGFHTVIARITSENEPSIALHRACGFEVVGVEREIGRKHGRWLDVVELQRMV